MAVAIPEHHRDLLDGPVIVSLVTVMPDGQPQATPVWCNTDGPHILINTARGRQKDKNLIGNPKVTILAIDPKNPYRWIEVRGRVVDSTEEGGVDHISALSKLYVNRDYYYADNPEQRHKETRVIYKILPDKINTGG